MSSSNFNADNAVIPRNGRWEYAYVNSQRCLVPMGTNSEMAIKATGTDCTVKMAVTVTGTNYLQASVDGGAFADLTMPGSANTYTNVTLFTGLSDAAHTVIIRHNAGTSNHVMVQVLNGVTVTGASPAIALPSGYGPYYDLSTQDGRAYHRIEGLVNDDGSAGYLRCVFHGLDGAIRFRSNATSIKIWCFRSGAIVSVWKDGVAVTTATNISNTSDYGWITIGSGFDGSYHEFVIALGFITPSFYTVQIMHVGGDVDKTNVPKWRPAIVGVGDSILAGNVLFDSTLGYQFGVAILKNFQSINFGGSGRKCLGTGVTDDSAERSDPGTLAPNVRPENVVYVIVEIGHNDNAADMTEFQASYTRLLARTLASFPLARIIALATIDTSAYSSTVRNNLNAAISNAVTAVGNARITYVDTTGWVTHFVDATHPTAAGYQEFVTALAPYITEYAEGQGFGPDPVTLDVFEDDGTTPAVGVSVFITKSSDRSDVVAGPLTTDGSGQVTFKLTDGGSYYVWAEGTSFGADGQAFTAVKD